MSPSQPQKDKKKNNWSNKMILKYLNITKNIFRTMIDYFLYICVRQLFFHLNINEIYI